jgi:hypothetical protein
MKKINSRRDLWDTIKHADIYLRRILREKIEGIFEEIMPENISVLMKILIYTPGKLNKLQVG